MTKFSVLFGFQCCQCLRKVCPPCLENIQYEDCDEGDFSDLKISPVDVITKGIENPLKWKILKRENRQPLFVFINKKSGGQLGETLIRRLSRYLNPIQIVDLNIEGPLPMLKKIQKAKITYKILVCGGDGTAAWILSAIDELKKKTINYIPPVAILPMGTGNDLSRVLGWGPGYDNGSVDKILYKIKDSRVALLDRWCLEITQIDEEESRVPQIMNNYFSIGLDAQIALDFHRKRESNPSEFTSRGFNKFVYAELAFSSLFTSSPCINDFLKIDLDGNHLELPPGLVSVIVLNFGSWAAGQNPWGSPKGWPEQSFSDKKFELVGITSISHMGKIQTGIDYGIRLGQGCDIVFTHLQNKLLAFQLDGEPWEEEHCIVRLSHFCQSPMLVPSKSKLQPLEEVLTEPTELTELTIPTSPKK